MGLTSGTCAKGPRAISARVLANTRPQLSKLVAASEDEIGKNKGDKDGNEHGPGSYRFF